MRPIAYYALFVDSFIMIYDIEYGINDYVIYTYKTLSKESRKFKAKIRYDKAGNAYFREKILYCFRNVYVININERNDT